MRPHQIDEKRSDIDQEKPADAVGQKKRSGEMLIGHPTELRYGRSLGAQPNLFRP
jgi:hypothetical protein